MAESVESVKAVAAFLRGAAEKNTNPDTKAVLAAHADTVESACEDLIRLKGLTSALPPDLGNVYDLPAELLEELSIAKTDDLEDQLVTVINAYGGEASLDQVLVGLYRKFKVSQKRRFLQNKLYRMDMVWSVDGRKGFYTTTKPVISANNWDDEPEAQTPTARSRDDMDDAIPF
jgi:hypothetical protein